MYDINWNNFVNWLLPAVLRKPRMTAWLLACLAPVIVLNAVFGLFRQAVDRDVAVTPQVRVLSYFLNEMFNPGDPGAFIFISDATSISVTWLFTESENKPLYLPTFVSGTVGDFIVNVPAGLRGQENAIRAFVNKYKLPGKRYEIVYY
jgi:hypothetical protein